MTGQACCKLLLVMTVVLSLVFDGLGLRAVYRPVGMLGRGIDRVQPQRRIGGGVDEVVCYTGRDDNSRTVPQRVPLTIQDGFAFSSLDPDELVAITMLLQADLLARLQRHHYQLHVWCGEEHLSEMFILNGSLLDIDHVTCHVLFSCHFYRTDHCIGLINYNNIQVMFIPVLSKSLVELTQQNEDCQQHATDDCHITT